MNSTLKEQIDFYIEFKDWYFKILNDLNFNYEKDREARDFLSQILIHKSEYWNLENILISFRALIQEKSRIVIYGCGPSLENTVETLLKNIGKNFFNNCINLTADGASILLKEKGIHIHGIFTDLDGITKEEFKCSDFVVVHAHGDNIRKLKLFENEILNFINVIGTTQIEPLKNVINPGGFTDGDRILFFLRTLLKSNHKIFLIGMDFNDIIGKYSKPEMSENKISSPIKQKKLQYAVTLIEWLTRIIKNEIYFVNSKEVSKKFKYLSISQFEKMRID